MKKKHVDIVLGILIAFLIACSVVLLATKGGQHPVTIPAEPAIKTPLVEFSVDNGESWQTLTQDEVVRVQAESALIRPAPLGKVFEINVRADLAPPRFKGSIGFDETKKAVRAAGKGAVVIEIRNSGYAKIILEPEKPNPKG